MKSNDNQKRIINTLTHHIDSWRITNDITSPSHWSLNDEWYTGLPVELQDSLEQSGLNITIGLALDELLALLRQIK